MDRLIDALRARGLIFYSTPSMGSRIVTLSIFRNEIIKHRKEHTHYVVNHRYRIENEKMFVEILRRILSTGELNTIIRNVNLLAREQEEIGDTIVARQIK